jgi:hypothetical protein
LYAVLPNVEALDSELENSRLAAYNPDSLLEMEKFGKEQTIGKQRAAITGKLHCLTMPKLL